MTMSNEHSTGRSDGHALSQSRALSVPSRVELLGILRSSTVPLTAQELAAGCGLHPSTVQQHLVVLADAGLVAGETRPQQGRGRPKRAYSAVTPPNAHLDLNRILVRAITDPDTARDIGRLHGKELPPSVEGPAETLRREAEHLGFDPTLTRDKNGRARLVLRRCPIASIASENAAVVCALHRGIAEGVLNAEGSTVLEKFVANDPEAAGCWMLLGPGVDGHHS